MTITLYQVDTDMWVKFRIAALQQGNTVNEAVQIAISDWLHNYNVTAAAQTMKRTP